MPRPSQPELGGKLAGLSLPRQVAVLAIWPFLEQVLNITVGTVDLALAGRLPESARAASAVDALGVTTFIMWLLSVVVSAVGVGGAALIARAIGGRHRRLANAALGQAVLLAVGVGALAGAAVYLVATPIGLAMSRQGDALEFVGLYLRIVAIAAPAQAVLLVGGACLRAAGDTRAPFAVMVVVNAVNVGASVLLVFGPAPFGGHGVAGIAAGTVVAWVVGAALIVGAMLHRRAAVRLRRHRLRPHAHTLQRIIRVGLPNLIETAGGTWLATFLVMIIVGRLQGEYLVGVHMIAVRIESYSFLPGMALGVAASTLAGQYLGLGDPHRAKQAVALCWGLGAALMGSAGVVFMLAPDHLARIITTEAVLVDQAAPLIRLCGAIQVFFASYMVLSFALRGAGDTRTTMKLTYLSVYTLRVPGALVLGVVLGLGLYGVWIALCAELTFKGLLFAGRFLHGGWARVEV